MLISDVKIGDRCWCQWINGTPTDENGQNATVIAVDSYIHCRPDDHAFGSSWKVSVDSFLWRKPEAPPKPKRKVTKTGWMNKYPWGYSMVYLDPVSAEDSADKLERLGCVQVSWEEIE